METPYWQKMETQDSLRDWMEFYQGCLACDCDHGCRGWIFENRVKTMLIMRILAGNGDTNLDRVAKMPLKRAAEIVHWLNWRDVKRANTR